MVLPLDSRCWNCVSFHLLYSFPLFFCTSNTWRGFVSIHPSIVFFFLTLGVPGAAESSVAIRTHVASIVLFSIYLPLFCYLLNLYIFGKVFTRLVLCLIYWMYYQLQKTFMLASLWYWFVIMYLLATTIKKKAMVASLSDLFVCLFEIFS